MRLFILILVIFVPFAIGAKGSLPYGYPGTERSKQCLNTGWKFHLGDPEASFYQAETDDSTWETVSVPHTLKLTSLTLDFCADDKTQPTFQRTVGWYRRSIEVTDDPHKKVFVEFEGAHQVTDLWVNGKHAGQFSVGGYNPFHFDISKFVQRGGPNQITVLVDNRRSNIIPPDPGPFDYVKFSGLYRDVYLVETDPLHITFNWEALHAGITITTPSVDPVNKNAVVDVKTVVRNEYPKPKKAKVIQRVVDQNGLVVLKLESEAIVAAGADFEFDQIGSMEDDVQLWDIDNPYLYRINTVVELDGRPVDIQENKLGIRKFHLDTERGFMLNNKPIKLIGFNRHQHYAYIGDAVPNSLHYKDMLQFKQLGFNVVRTAHYPQDNALIEACDELGMLVYEEAPTWISVSKEPAWWNNLEKSTRIMVRNHRNHPSIVFWGGGINHRGYVPRVNEVIKQEDPWRLTASPGSSWTGWQASGLSDVYANMLYGPFIWDRSEPIFAMEGKYGPVAIAEYKRDPKMTGIISWTAHAYHTFHPTHSKYNSKHDRTRGGMMSIFRQPRKEMFWYPAEMKHEPYLYIADQWKLGIAVLTVYSNADEIELLVNDQSLGRYLPSKDSVYFGLEHPPFEIPITDFEAGKLSVVGYMNGAKGVEQITYTPERPERINLVLDTVGRTWEADGSDILVAYAQVIDKYGTIIKDFEGNVEFSITGDAQIIGDQVDINANPMFIQDGEAPVLLKAGTKAGKVKLIAHCPGLKRVVAETETLASEDDMVAKNACPIYDFEKVRVDLGAPNQVVQFGWKEWNTQDNHVGKIHLDVFGGCEAVIKTNSGDGILRWLGEMNVVGKFGYAYGDGVLGIDQKGIILEFETLPKGVYKLTTWHHAPRTNTDLMDPNREKAGKIRILDLPYAKEIEVSVGERSNRVHITYGKEMQFQAPATSHLVFESDGVHPVQVLISDPNGEKGIWLNAFEIKEWK